MEEISREEFDVLMREALQIKYPKQIAEGKIYETKNGWVGIKLKK